MFNSVGIVASSELLHCHTMTSPSSKTTISWSSVAKDITVYGGTAVAVISAVAQNLPGASIPAGVQAVIAAVIPVLTAIMSIAKERDKAQTVAQLKAQIAVPQRRAGR